MLHIYSPEQVPHKLDVAYTCRDHQRRGPCPKAAKEHTGMNELFLVMCVKRRKESVSTEQTAARGGEERGGLAVYLSPESRCAGPPRLRSQTAGAPAALARPPPLPFAPQPWPQGAGSSGPRCRVAWGPRQHPAVARPLAPGRDGWPQRAACRPIRKRHSFLSFPSVCPEPVLVKR